MLPVAGNQSRGDFRVMTVLHFDLIVLRDATVTINGLP